MMETPEAMLDDTASINPDLARRTLDAPRAP